MSKPLTTAEATALLKVKPATLYSYVSRGLVRSEAGPAGTRERRYNAEDVHALVKKQQAKQNPAQAVQDAVDGALHWGTPVLESALTQISDHTLSFCGQEATQLAKTATVEEVAALMWTGESIYPQSQVLPLRARLNLSAHPQASLPTEALAYALTYAGSHDMNALDHRAEALPLQAARVLNLLYATLEKHEAVPPAPDLPLHARLARAWGVSKHAEALRVALILLTDHELNVSAFTARVTASSGASLHHCVLAALAALQGPKHGLAPLDAYDLLAHAQQVGSKTALQDATRRLGHMPSFGHPLYPNGDPRAQALLDTLEHHFAQDSRLKVVLDLKQTAEEETGAKPNVDLALAALIWLLDRPAHDAPALFALARSTGWLAHAIETKKTGQMIRPRARYVGK